MIAFLHKYFSNIPAVFIDGTLYALIAWFTFNQSYLSGDESAKWIEPGTKFWLNWAIGSGATVFAAIKMFRSTAYADHKSDKLDSN
jgi:hypothetical protein